MRAHTEGAAGLAHMEQRTARSARSASVTRNAVADTFIPKFATRRLEVITQFSKVILVSANFWIPRDTQIADSGQREDYGSMSTIT